MQERGKWKHPVPRQEEGEPPAKQQKWWERPISLLDVEPRLPERSPEAPLAAPAEADSDSPPPLENSPTEEGTSCRIQVSVS